MQTRCKVGQRKTCLHKISQTPNCTDSSWKLCPWAWHAVSISEANSGTLKSIFIVVFGKIFIIHLHFYRNLQQQKHLAVSKSYVCWCTPVLITLFSYFSMSVLYENTTGTPQPVGIQLSPVPTSNPYSARRKQKKDVLMEPFMHENPLYVSVVLSLFESDCKSAFPGCCVKY